MHDWSWLGFDDVPVALNKGSTLFHQGRPVERMFYISSGRIKLIRHTQEGETVILHVGTPGEMIAEASLFSEKYHCSALADQTSKIYSIEKSLALTHILSKPENSKKMLKLFSRQIRDLRGLIETRNIRSAQSRILSYLTNLADDKGKVILHTSLRDIAYKLGLAHETLYRELRSLEEGGVITRPEPGIINLR